MTAGYTIRPVRADEWREARALRLAALTDEAAGIAFLETYDEAVVRPDDFWQERTARSSSDAGPEADVRQFVAVADDGTWVGTAAALVEKAGTEDYSGETIAQDAGHVVAVYLHPDHRGRGVMEDLFDAATGWFRERGLRRARLHVHEDNARAERFYARYGFRPTGEGFDGPHGWEREMVLPL
ncbi:GNAT family N-acetyltransferase [Blastococcus saxobsidens]|uniref:GNAT family N-acetyltransferase n=1 Tax=Blastococcus saxobsidens TaxID=138336 RepID=A0A6L9W1E4_9ACTN|nr:GNAT family N-acetyltransferase [Blastococcus saxobsidens]NEK85291.1 GNAT family N-acetyltransferase [Blastococcus saxobsidens]